MPCTYSESHVLEDGTTRMECAGRTRTNLGDICGNDRWPGQARAQRSREPGVNALGTGELGRADMSWLSRDCGRGAGETGSDEMGDNTGRECTSLTGEDAAAGCRGGWLIRARNECRRVFSSLVTSPSMGLPR